MERSSSVVECRTRNREKDVLVRRLGESTRDFLHEAAGIEGWQSREEKPRPARDDTPGRSGWRQTAGRTSGEMGAGLFQRPRKPPGTNPAYHQLKCDDKLL